MKEIDNMHKIFNSFQEYIESEDMVFKTLESDMETVTIGCRDKKVRG